MHCQSNFTYMLAYTSPDLERSGRDDTDTLKLKLTSSKTVQASGSVSMEHL